MAVRILHVVDSLNKGGLENGLVNLIHGLSPAHFEHIVCATRRLGPNAERLPRERVKLIFLDKDNSGSRFQIPALARVIRENRPDVVHSRNWGAVEAIIAGRWVRGCSLIHSEHGILTDAIAGEPWRRICFRRLAYELADRVVSVSHQLRDLQAQRTGFPAHKITVIHNGVDTTRFCPATDIRLRIRQELGLAPEEFCIGCVANLFPVKDHMTLLKAVQELAQHHHSWRLLLIGEGSERAGLESFVSLHPEWKHRVHFLGLSHRVAELLQAMDVFALTSASEGISNSLLEAMASGVPAVATLTGGNPEVVVNGESGILCPVGGVQEFAEAFRLLASDGERRAKLAQGALHRVRENFSLGAMIRKYEELYTATARRSVLPQGMAAEV